MVRERVKLPEEQIKDLKNAILRIEDAIADNVQNAKDASKVVREIKAVLFPELQPTIWQKIRKFLTNK